MRVFVVDDHSLFRDGLTSLLRAAGIDVIGEAGDGEQAVRDIERLLPDLVLMDLNMPRMSGLEALEQIRSRGLETKVIMLTVSDRSDDMIAAIESGANGYLLKSLDSQAFLAKLRGIERGEAAISGEMTMQLMAHIAHKAKEPAGSSASHSLTERELEMLALLARGMPNREIAQTLFISENTVKYHIKHILQKLDLKNRAEAAAYAVQKGLVEIE